MLIFRLKNLISNKSLIVKHTLGGVCNSVLGSLKGLPPLLFLLLSSCSVSLFNGYQRNDAEVAVTPVSWFEADTGHFLFNTRIDLFRNHYSGIMVIKQVSPKTYRVVFITEVGLKIFDMEFFPDREVKVHFIMEAMNKKALIKTLSNDIGLILMNRLVANEPVILHKKASNYPIFKYSDQGRKNYYYISGSGGRPFHIKQRDGITNKLKADLYGSDGSGIDSIKIDHYNIRLSINLFRINEEINHVTE